MLKERKLTYRIGPKGQRQSAIVRTVYEFDGEPSVEDFIEFFRKIGNGSPEATLTRLAVFFRGLLESQGWPEGRTFGSMTSADIDAFAGDHLGKRRAVDALQGCENAIELIQKNDSKSALSWATMAFISGIFAAFGQFEEQALEAGLRALSNWQSKRAKHDRTKCPVRASFIKAMHAFRSNGGTCQDFIDAAQNGSIDGAFLKRKETRGVEVYSASTEADEELPKEKIRRADRRAIEAKQKTLNDWWTEAGKELPG